MNSTKELKKPTVTAVIIARNESAMITACIETLSWCDVILVINNGSTDDTVQKAENAGAKVITFASSSFARVREEAMKHVTTEWILYIDADERVTPTLAKQIAVHIETGAAAALSMHRKNYFFGHPVAYGGWQKDVVTRAFKLSELKGWSGDIHESAQWSGTNILLQSALIHLTHRSVVDNLKKSAEWTPVEAQAYIDGATPLVTFKTILRKGLMEFWRRGIRDQGYKDGTVGLIEALIQAINRMWVYIQVWELQQKPTVSERYEHLEEAIKKKWEQES